MDHNNTKSYVAWGLSCALFFALGYLLYPQINTRDYMPEMTGQRYNSSDMGHSMMSKNTLSLEGKSGAKFDEAFLEEMIPHHQGAVEMARLVLTSTKRPELIKLANEIIESQQSEINMMRGWQRTWFGVQPE